MAIGFPVHTQPVGRQNRNIISIILTFSPVMYSFNDKIFVLESPPLHADSLFQKLCAGSAHNRMTVIFHGQKPYRHEIFFHR